MIMMMKSDINTEAHAGILFLVLHTVVWSLFPPTPPYLLLDFLKNIL